jgi:hypothetical protein
LKIPDKSNSSLFPCPLFRCSRCGTSFQASEAVPVEESEDPVDVEKSVHWYATSNGLALIFASLGILIAGMVQVAIVLHRQNEVARATAAERAKLRAEEEERLAKIRGELEAEQARQQAEADARQAQETQREGEAAKQKAEAARREKVSRLEGEFRSTYKDRCRLSRNKDKSTRAKELDKKGAELMAELTESGVGRERIDKMTKEVRVELREEIKAEIARHKREAAEVTATQLIKDYADNEVDADKKYKGQWVRVKGEVRSVKKPPFGGEGCTVFMHSDDRLSFGSVGCEFDDDRDGEGVETKYIYEIVGKCKGKTLATVFLEECHFILKDD